MNRYAILLALSIFFSQEASAVCSAEQNECDFYCQTNETLGCSDTNYLVRFGGHYCKKFLGQNELYSPHGQLVLSRIRSCLVRSLATKRFTCETVEDIAFNDHVSCYVDNGFCNLGNDDRALIMWSVRRELTNPKFQAAAASIVLACGLR